MGFIMHWDAVCKTFISDTQTSILKAFERSDAIDFENILCHDQASYFELAALALHFNRPDCTSQLNGLHDTYAFWGETKIPKHMSQWFEPHDITCFANTFSAHNNRHWFDVAGRMVQESNNDELQEVLKLKDPTGNHVLNPLHSNSFLLWLAAGKGNRQAFDMLLPHSDLSHDGYRCFIAAVYNNHYDIANDIVNDCLSRNSLKGLMDGVRLFAREKFYDHNESEDDKVREMVALIQRGKISVSVAPVCASRTKKM